MPNKTLTTFIYSLALLIAGFTIPAYGTTQDTYQKVSPSVLQVLLIDKASGTKSSFGSGFFVDEHGLVITNFHVISDLVFHPERHKAEYLNAFNEKGGLELLHFDVVNDLAIMRSQSYHGPAISISVSAPPNGARIYAMGHPHDLGLSVVEGTYNGLLEHHLIPRIHYTGALNPGMSGGPALNQKNELIGVNVAGMGNAVSFLVPARYVKTLIEKSSSEGIQDVTDEVSRQLTDHQHRFLEPLINDHFARLSIGPYQVAGKLSGAFECWGKTREPDERLFNTSSHNCETSDYVYLSADDYTGTIEYQHEYFSTEKLGQLRFYSFLERHMQSIHASTAASEKRVTPFACKEKLLTNNDIDMKVVTCLREHKVIENLYDFLMVLTTANRPDEALYSVVMVSGVSYDNGIAFQKNYLDAISMDDVVVMDAGQ